MLFVVVKWQHHPEMSFKAPGESMLSLYLVQNNIKHLMHFLSSCRVLFFFLSQKKKFMENILESPSNKKLW